jgi:hypothetical protein
MVHSAICVLLILIGLGFGTWGVYMCERVSARGAYLIVTPVSWLGALPIAAGIFGLLE